MSDVHAAAERKIAKQLIDDCVADVVDRFSGHTRARMSTRHEDAVRACIAAHVHGAFAALHPADDGDAIDEAAVVALCCYVVYTNQAIRNDARQLALRILEGIDQGRTPIGTRRVIAKSDLSQL